MFTYICTYHHIFPEFADLVYTFGQNNLDDFSHTRFIRGDEEYQAIPELSRSQRQSRISYKLFAMEESDYDNKWTMRQTVVYHSLDLHNGRIFWLILKANDVIRNRIREDDANKRRHPTGVPKNAAEAMEAAFKTHMALLDWSCEGWRWYITQLEEQAKPNLVKVTAAPIPSEDAALDPVPRLMEKLSIPLRTDTQFSIKPPRPETQDSGLKTAFQRPSAKYGLAFGLRLLASYFKRGIDPATSEARPSDLVVAFKDREAQIDQTRKRLDILRDFSLKGPQSLTAILSKVNEAKTAMSMNIRMSEDLRSYYKDLFESKQLDATTIDACENVHRQFQWKVKSLERLLEMECLRADALAEKIRTHTTLVSMPRMK
ncbi:hypothetical protein G7054_g9552 [Neopestalotiopsis clavispora]|nr:hypothetical protein G7054_g9552 [Neopestalotiopsis clavispora]